MTKSYSRRSFMESVTALATMIAVGGGHELIAQPLYVGLEKTLRTSEWPELTPLEKEMFDLPISDSEAKKLIDTEINRCVYNNPNVQNAVSAYQIDGKPMELKRGTVANIALDGTWVSDGFIGGAIKRAHKNNPGKKELTIGDYWDAFLDHCSYHVLKDCIRWLCAKAQGIKLSGNVVTKSAEASAKDGVPIYKMLTGQEIEDWDILKNPPFDPKTLDISNDRAVEDAAKRLSRYDLLAMMKKLGVGTSLLRPSPASLCVLSKNQNVAKFLLAKSVTCQVSPNT